MLELLSVSPQRLSRWERSGLVPVKRSYRFQDLLSLRKLQTLSRRIPLRALRDGLSAMRQREPNLDPLAEAGLFAERHRLEVSLNGLRMDPISGQLSFAFSGREAASSIAELRATARESPGAAEDWFAYGVTLEDRPENRDLAAAAYLRCLEVDPRHASACINLGTLRYHQANFAEAEACYRRAIAIDPTYALAYFDLGNVLDETNRLLEAIQAYARAVGLAPRYADAHYNLALAYEKSGQRRRAMPHWRQYLKLDSGSAWAMHARAQLRRSLAREQLSVVRRPESREQI